MTTGWWVCFVLHASCCVLRAACFVLRAACFVLRAPPLTEHSTPAVTSRCSSLPRSISADVRFCWWHHRLRRPLVLLADDEHHSRSVLGQEPRGIQRRPLFDGGACALGRHGDARDGREVLAGGGWVQALCPVRWSGKLQGFRLRLVLDLLARLQALHGSQG